MDSRGHQGLFQAILSVPLSVSLEPRAWPVGVEVRTPSFEDDARKRERAGRRRNDRRHQPAAKRKQYSEANSTALLLPLPSQMRGPFFA
jgi:hypothetical protein